MKNRISLYSFLFMAFFALNKELAAQINAGQNDTICGGSTTLNATLSTAGATVTNLSLLDDQFSGAINIGFPFTFYGVSYTQCLISSNNYVSFDLTNANGYSPWSINNPVPNAGNPLNATMGPWQDINPGVGGTVRYATLGTAPNRIFVVEYCNIPMFSCTNLAFSSQIQLHENGNIVETHIINKPLCTTWNSGQAIHAMHNSAGTVADVVTGRNAASQWTTSNEGYRFTPNGASSYTITPIPFNPVVLGASGNVTWTTTTGSAVGTGLSVTVSPASTTSYVASIQDLCSGFTFSDTVTVVVSAPFNFSGSSTTVSSCSVPTGSATVNVSNGSGNYLFQWDAAAGNQTSSTAGSLGAGSYTVNVSDISTGCSIDTTFVVDDNNTLSVSITNPQNISCNGANDGEATASFTGGLGNETYAWSPSGQTGSTATGLNPGTHTVTITDVDGCTGTAQVIITQPSAITVNVSGSDVSCFGDTTGTATVTSFGGNGGPYQFSWNDPDNQTTSTASGLAAGTYSVSVIDAAGCVSTGTITINEPTALSTIINSGNVSCNGASDGYAAVIISGGTVPYSYSWPLSGSTADSISNLFAGTYSVLVTDANGCSISDTVTITQPVALSVAISVVDATCGTPDGSLSVTVNGGTAPYSYNWSGGQNTQTASGLLPGSYSVTITDANGCFGNGIATVGSVNNQLADFSASPTSGIYPLPVTFSNNSQNTSTFYWDFGNGDTLITTSLSDVNYTFNSPGTYQVTLVAVNTGGCSDTATLSIMVINESTLLVPNVFTPNGDQMNDLFLPEYTYIVEYQCVIFNRWGQEVWFTNDIDNGWDGKKNGNDVNEGTYFYYIKAKGVDNKDYDLSGTVNLFRNK